MHFKTPRTLRASGLAMAAAAALTLSAVPAVWAQSSTGSAGTTRKRLCHSQRESQCRRH
jgi:hypothetical protein